MSPLRNVVLATTLSAVPFLAFSAPPVCKSTDAQCIANAPVSSTQTSKPRAVSIGVVSGLMPVKISVDRGEYKINSGAFTSTPGTIRNKDTLTVRVAAATTPGTEVAQTVKIAGLPDQVFRVITAGTASTAPPVSPTPPAQPRTFIRWSSYGKLTLPVDADGKNGADEIPATALDTYSSIYFYGTSAGQKTAGGYVAANGETVFWAPVNGGGLTPSAKFVRSEMREQWANGNSVNWSMVGVHTQSGRLKVTQLPKPKVAGGRVGTVFAQLHSNNNSPPVKLVFVSTGSGTYAYGTYNNTTEAGNGVASAVKIPVSIGQSLTYEITMNNGIVTSKINDQVIDTRDLRQEWAGQTFYFKAGNYVQNGTDTATGAAEVVYSSISASHN